ncbi:PCYCGC motif-containing (lipo)protein [Paenibacillus xanthanilyticus]|uniref:PCYCGC motif-containing (Lipo)protein n=1 Tax=Paenibacillus xanthanilyticus TaxID=1783531 RepID=A0ABV8KDA2_9BACL
MKTNQAMLNLRRTFIYGTCAAALAISLSGCAGGKAEKNVADAVAVASAHAGHADTHLPNGDLRQTTAGVETLPAFLTDAHGVIVQAYQAAATAQDVLAYIPCYCGCGDSAGHRSNLECFIHETKPDGSVTWDDHGTRCGTCMEIAVQAAVMKQEGKSVSDIRSAIETKYSSQAQYATDTPPPPAS